MVQPPLHFSGWQPCAGPILISSFVFANLIFFFLARHYLYANDNSAKKALIANARVERDPISSAKIFHRAPRPSDPTTTPLTDRKAPPRGRSHRTNHPRRHTARPRYSQLTAAAAHTAAVAVDPRSRILPGTKSITHFPIGSDSNVLACRAIRVDTVSLPCHHNHQPLISGEFYLKTTPFALSWISDATATTTTSIAVDVVITGRRRPHSFFPRIFSINCSR